jgi:hypothetical protein
MQTNLATLKAKRDALMVLLEPLEKLHLLAGTVQAVEAKGQDLRTQLGALNRKIKTAEAGDA